MLLFSPTPGGCDVDFEHLNGSDLGMGIGARAVGLAGAFTAVADDASAIFWNPSGLTQLSDHQLYLSVDLPAEISAAALIYRPISASPEGIDLAFGLGRINRLSFKGDSGSDPWDGYAANLLDMAMIDISDDFSGRISSNTNDIRLSMALTPPGRKKLSFGLNLAYIA